MDTKRRVVRIAYEPKPWIVEAVIDSMCTLIDASLNELRENWTAPLAASNLKASRFLQQALNQGGKR